MQILFENGVRTPIELTDSPIQDTILGIYKHLQHVPIPYYDWDSSLYLDNITHEELITRVIECGRSVGIQVDPDKAMGQHYINELHKIYEHNYDGSNKWLLFHENLHLLEECDYRYPGKCIIINYREKAGMLERPFNMDWIKYGTTKVRTGDVFIGWAELGKTPYEYWRTGEPNDIARICEFAKPWVKLKLRLSIVTQDADMIADKQIDEFNEWWSQYKDEWCHHWNIPDWTVNNMYSPLVFGHINQLDTVVNLLEQKIYPKQRQL